MKNKIKVIQKQLLHSRFSSGVELLGNPNESARIGGAYNLYFLASENPEYVATVCEILCTHIRSITSEKEYQAKHDTISSNEIQTVINLLFKKEYNLIFDKCGKNLRRVFLYGIDFSGTTLKHVDFTSATLRQARFFVDATLSDVSFNNATFENLTYFGGTSLESKTPEEITCEGCSLELTKSKEENE